MFTMYQTKLCIVLDSSGSLYVRVEDIVSKQSKGMEGDGGEGEAIILRRMTGGLFVITFEQKPKWNKRSGHAILGGMVIGAMSKW